MSSNTFWTCGDSTCHLRTEHSAESSARTSPSNSIQHDSITNTPLSACQASLDEGATILAKRRQITSDSKAQADIFGKLSPEMLDINKIGLWQEIRGGGESVPGVVGCPGGTLDVEFFSRRKAFLIGSETSRLAPDGFLNFMKKAKLAKELLELVEAAQVARISLGRLQIV